MEKGLTDGRAGVHQWICSLSSRFKASVRETWHIPEIRADMSIGCTSCSTFFVPTSAPFPLARREGIRGAKNRLRLRRGAKRTAKWTLAVLRLRGDVR